MGKEYASSTVKKKVEKQIGKHQVENKFDGSGAKLRILNNGKKKFFLKNYDKKEVAKKDKIKNKKIEEKLRNEEGICAPKIILSNDEEGFILFEHFYCITFEKYYVKNISDDKKIKKYFDKITKGLVKIHNIKPKSEPITKPKGIDVNKNDVVFAHDDFHLENILIDKTGEVVFIDSPGIYESDYFYRDLARFLYHMTFKIPYKYKSMKAYFLGKKYGKYFIEEYEIKSRRKIDYKKLNKFRIENLKIHQKQIKKLKINKIEKFILITHLEIRILLLSF